MDWKSAGRRESRTTETSSMKMALMVAGVFALLAGLLAILLGIPVKEFSFGNTLILSGCIGACTGLILLGLSAVVAELKLIARRLAADPRSAAADARVRAALPQVPSAPTPPAQAGEGGFLFGRDRSAAEQMGHDAPTEAPPMSPPLWQEETVSRAPQEPQPVEAVPAARPKRNLLFQSTMRKDRERGAARGADSAASEIREPSPVSEAGEVQPPSFDNAWSRTERARGEISSQRRSGRAVLADPPAAAAERTWPPVPARGEDQPAVTILKSGVVDGMAYSLYSDGSIEAQMPEGLMRFASLDELTAHIERRS
jgi:hypothetical protein